MHLHLPVLGARIPAPWVVGSVLTYLTGELWRRVGDSVQAHQWFKRVQSELTDPATQQWVVDAARQQRDCAREWFG